MIGDRIYHARKIAGLTQKSLAELTQIPLSLIRRFEKNTTIPTSKELLSLAQACGLRTEYFFREDTVKLIDTHWCT